MGLHSMCGYASGFIGPLGVGLALDLAGKNFVLGWDLGFGQLAIVSLVGLVFVRRLGSRQICRSCRKSRARNLERLRIF